MPIRQYGMSFDLPLPASVDPWALVLSLAAILAILRFNAGMIATLAASTTAGLLLHVAGFGA